MGSYEHRIFLTLAPLAMLFATFTASAPPGMAQQPPPSSASGATDACDTDGDGEDDGVIINGHCRPRGPEPQPGPDPDPEGPEDGTYPETTLTYPCEPNDPNEGITDVRCDQLPMCGMGQRNETTMPYWEWQRQVTWRSGEVVDRTRWSFSTQVCLPPEEAPDELRTPTREEITEQVKQVLPKGEPLVQPPNGRTLINLDTIFRVDTGDIDPFEATVEVIGQDVGIRARPTSFSWNFGDGSPRFETTEAGRPYPHKDIVHVYEQIGRHQVDVDIAYATSFRVEGSDWTDLGEIEITDGPAMPLRVFQNRTALSD